MEYLGSTFFLDKVEVEGLSELQQISDISFCIFNFIVK